MINSGFLGIGLIAYASWQTITFLKDKGARIWARSRYHQYSPRPTKMTMKTGKKCGSCSSFRFHADYLNAGTCEHASWKIVMQSDEVMVRKDGHCELWEKSSAVV